MAAEPFAGAGAVFGWGDAEALSLDLVPAGAVAPLLPRWRRCPTPGSPRRATRRAISPSAASRRTGSSPMIARCCAGPGEIVGFAVVLRGALDQGMERRHPPLPARARPPRARLHPAALLRLAKARGVRRFDLGLTPTPDLAPRRISSPTWRRVTPMLFRLGDQFRDFDALRGFKARYEPRLRAALPRLHRRLRAAAYPARRHGTDRERRGGCEKLSQRDVEGAPAKLGFWFTWLGIGRRLGEIGRPRVERPAYVPSQTAHLAQASWRGATKAFSTKLGRWPSVARSEGVWSEWSTRTTTDRMPLPAPYSAHTPSEPTSSAHLPQLRGGGFRACFR